LQALRESARRLDGEDSFEYAITTWYLTQLALREGDAAGGLPLLEEAMKRWPSLVGPHHKVYALSHRLRAGFARLQGDLALAEREQRAALARQTADSANPMSVAYARAELARIRFEQGHRQEARALLAQAMPLIRRSVSAQQVDRVAAETLAARL